jgi:SlyX protein
MTDDVDTLKRQMLELQSQFAFQEDAIRNLDEALAAQQREIMILQRQFELLRQRQQELAAQRDAGEQGAPADERPPHY